MWNDVAAQFWKMYKQKKSSLKRPEERKIIFFCQFSFQLKEFEGKETAQLVDRYKFLDLFPCGVVELRSIGYSDVNVLLSN